MAYFRLFYLFFPGFLVLILLSLGAAPDARATDEGPRLPEPVEEPEQGHRGYGTRLWESRGRLRNSSMLAPREAFARAAAVLEHFGVPREPEPQDSLDDLQGSQTASRLATRARSLDLGGKFASYSSVTPELLEIFQDADSREVPDFLARLAPEGAVPFDKDFHLRIRRASLSNAPEQPLAGLRIALDPGHMGGAPWDERSGKFVRDRKGNRLSEGLLVLQLARLLEQEFTARGAEVLITHRSLAPVSPIPYESFDLRPMALEELRESVPRDWFRRLLSAAPAGAALFDAFSSSPEFRALFSESRRWRYFFQRADLEARAATIRDFAPDLTLVLHLDAAPPAGDPTGVNPRGYNRTKAYVAGGFFADELATRAQRRDFARHLLDEHAWNASVSLSGTIVGQIRSQLGIPLETSGMGNSLPVRPGVFARNLNVQRRITGSATSYLECLYYNDPAEFSALRRYTRTLEIDGVAHGYSERLVQLATAVRDGVLEFVRGYSN
ncbi:MAG: hypothetical protein NDJ89_02205 [Oligoflexia bacterium]|nr:hypothetical protein [Oligoflexia bacterium]